MFPKIVVPPKCMVNNGKTLIKMDDLGVPLFLETPIYTSTFQFVAIPNPEFLKRRGPAWFVEFFETHFFPSFELEKNQKVYQNVTGLIFTGKFEMMA